MEHLDNRGAAGELVGSGSNQVQDITVRDQVRSNLGLASGRGANAQSGRGSYRKRVDIDEARRSSGNQDDEDDVSIRNGSATRETPWKGLVNNDINYVWNHGPKFEGGFHCLYCNLRKRGGGATRFKEHLGHVGSEVIVCPNVPRNVKAIMKNALYETRKKKRQKATNRLRLERDIMDGLYQREGVINIEDDDDEELQMSLRESLRDKNVARAVERRRGSGSGVRVSLGKRSITAFFKRELSSNKVTMQPKITTAFDLESRDVLGQAWAKFFHANDIAGLKADCPYFRAALKITQQLGPTPLPTAKEIDGIFLDKNYDEATEWLRIFKQDWKNFGVTVMCDSWTGPNGMSIINFMVYCNKKMFFHKSIDASGQTQNSAAVLDPYTNYVVNMSSFPEFASTLTDVIEKIADPDSAVLALHEFSAFRDRRGRFGQKVARMSAEKMSPTEWWFQFGGEVPNLQKYALRIVSQCVSSSGCERNWSAWALIHTKPRNRLLYGKLHKFVSVRYNLKKRAEEDNDMVRENYKDKEVDPCAMMMDTAMFDEANPMMEWLNEDEEHIILDGSEAASAVFEEINRLNSSKKASHLGRKKTGAKRKRVMEEDEDDYIDSEDDDQEHECMEIDEDDGASQDDGQDDGASQDDGQDDGASQDDGEDSPSRVENEAEGHLGNRRSQRIRQAKKVKVTTFYN